MALQSSPDEFWKGRRIFLTGHTGFMGGWLSLTLLILGAEVTGFSLRPPTEPNFFDAVDLAKAMGSVIGDVRDPETLIQALNQARPDIAFHLAAQPLVVPSYRDPVGTYSTNVMGLVHFLEAVRKTPSVRAVVVVTSDKCYQNREIPRGYRETDPMGGHDPYSSSKGCAELVSEAYRRSFLENDEKALATVRAGNVLGGGDFAPFRLVPDLVRAFSRGQAVSIRHPEAVRPWQHVLEPIQGYLVLARRLWSGEMNLAQGWNFGPSKEGMVPVRDIVRQAAALWGEDARWVEEPSSGPHEAQMLKLDCAKASEHLGWHPRLDLSATLAWTMDWYRAFFQGQKDMRQVSVDQIEKFRQGIKLEKKSPGQGTTP